MLGRIALDGAPRLLVYTVVQHVAGGRAHRIEIGDKGIVLAPGAFKTHLHCLDQNRFSGRHRNGCMPAPVGLVQHHGNGRRRVVTKCAKTLSRLGLRPLDKSLHPPPGCVASLRGERQARMDVARHFAIDALHRHRDGACRCCRHPDLRCRRSGSDVHTGSISRAGAAADEARNDEDERRRPARNADAPRPARAVAESLPGACAFLGPTHRPPGRWTRRPRRARWRWSCRAWPPRMPRPP